MKGDYTRKINFAMLNDAEITNMREELVLQMSQNSLKRVTAKQRERVAMLNPKVHILLMQYRNHALTYPKYNETAEVGEV
ncbi:MAG: hypothetical protein IJZ25_04575 [Lachnospiraceae bacterium]|nr:hypothetical protein [Lachnospiraceae bacterium]